MDELLAFLYAQLDEDARKIGAMEREETRIRTAPIFQGQPLGWLAGVDIFVSSKRWRAEVQAKRRILDEHQRVALTYWPTPMCGICADPAAVPVDDPLGSAGPWVPNQPWPCCTVRTLAQPYARREGWREEWTPGPSRA